MPYPVFFRVDFLPNLRVIFLWLKTTANPHKHRKFMERNNTEAFGADTCSRQADFKSQIYR